MKVCIVSGARPQFVKVAPIIREFEKQGVEVLHIHTGQHYDHAMSESFFTDLEIPSPQSNLGVGSGSHGSQTAKMISGIESQLEKHHPDLIMVVGDTNSTLAAGIAAIKIGIPIIHLEAGLRSHDWNMPEEINRILVDRITSLFICPTEEAVENLISEGIDRSNILLTGDVMVDSLYFAKNKDKQLSVDLPAKYFLATLHRQENVDEKPLLEEAFRIFQDAPLPVVLPLHPRTRKNLIEFGLLDDVESHENIILLPPVQYLEFTKLEAKSTGILTDSGGVQKEAFILSKPCITLRTTSEWVESIELGANRLTGIDYDQVLKVMSEIVDGHFTISNDHPYGNGRASIEIVDEIISRFHSGKISISPNTTY